LPVGKGQVDVRARARLVEVVKLAAERERYATIHFPVTAHRRGLEGAFARGLDVSGV